jgi:hypothetical protein
LTRTVKPGAPQQFAHELRAVLRVGQLALDAQLVVAASLMCRFFCTSAMIAIGSIGGLGRKLMFISFGPASILATP